MTSYFDSFQSTPPHGGRLDGYAIEETPGFNPRPRMGGDPPVGTGSADAPQVSIHAPAWGATCALIQPIHLENVSIHAPAWGATSIQ